MKDNRDLALGWLAKAESDLATADLVLQGEGPYDTACFHAQQAVEKSLKALLALHAQPIPRTHDLDELQRQALSVHPLPALASLDLQKPRITLFSYGTTSNSGLKKKLQKARILLDFGHFRNWMG